MRTHTHACMHMHAPVPIQTHSVSHTHIHTFKIPTNSLFADTLKHHKEEQIGTDSMFLPGSGSALETVKAGALRVRKSPE